MADLLLGIDGGNTKTEALLARRDGTSVAFARVLGIADIYAARTPADAHDVIAAAADEALVRAGATADDLAAIGFSLAGADWPEDFALHETELPRRYPGVPFRVTNDGIGALYALVPSGPGVVVAVGTGAATGARGPDGRTWHSSWWQVPQGGHELAERAAVAVYRADLGTGPATSLTERLLDYFDASDVEGALHRHTERGGRPGRIDAFAGALLEEAEAGDRVAADLVASQGRSLGDYAIAAARRVGIDLRAPFPLALTGGVFAHPGHVLCDALVDRVRGEAPLAEPLRSGVPPVVGALLLAAEVAGLPIEPFSTAVRASLATARERSSAADAGHG
jgi:N-acetylglucosamine kinase-like BadF-type ATPase